MQTTSYLYRPVLQKAWEITKKFKALWFFGLFSVLVSAGGEYEMISRAVYNTSEENFFNSVITGLRSGWIDGLKANGGSFWNNLMQLVSGNFDGLLLSFFVLLLLFVVIAIFFWLAVSSQVALIKGSSLANKNKKMNISEGFEFANKNFFPAMGVIIVLKAVLFALFLILGWESWLTASLGVAGTIIYILSFVVFILAVLIISFILKYQIFYLLLKKETFFGSLNKAWKLFVANWVISFEMSLIMLGVYIVASVISLLALTIAAGIPIIIIPFYLLSLNFAIKVLISVLAAALGIGSALFITATVATFQWSGWTVLFERLDGGEEISKLERIGDDVKRIPEMMFKK